MTIQTGFTIHTKEHGSYVLAPERILTNDVRFKGEFMSEYSELFVFGHEYGVFGAVWALNEQDALNTAADEGLLESFSIFEDESDAQTVRLGNSCHPFEISNVWIERLEFEIVRDFNLLMALAEARGAQSYSLEYHNNCLKINIKPDSVKN